MHSAQELVAHVEALTSLPTVYHRIREQLDAPDGSVVEAARLISADPAMSVRVLRVVNSALYGYGGQIDSINRAVAILGLQQVHDLVLAASVGTVFAGIQPAQMDVLRFWRGSVLRGLTARAIANASGLHSPERLFVIGLLSDLGHLVMYQTVPTLAQTAQTLADSGGEALHAVESRVVGCDYAEVGAALMESWKLPGCFAKIIGAQTRPRLGGEHALEAAILMVAVELAQADRNGESSEEVAARVPPALWSLIDFEPERLGEIREDAELNLAAYVALFFPNLHAR